MWPFNPRFKTTGFIFNEDHDQDPRNLCYEDIAAFGANPVSDSGNILQHPIHILNQGGSNSCTCHSSSADIYQVFNKFLSPRHAYWKIKTDPKYASSQLSYGAYMKDAITVFLSDGVCDYNLMPYDPNQSDERGFLNVSETPEIAINAAKNITGGSFIYPTLAGGSEAKFDATVRFMNEQHLPVKLGIEWHGEYNAASKDGIIPPVFVSSPASGHDICAVAWKTINNMPYIGCINSWGDSWGDHGLVWIPRTYVNIQTAVAILPPEVKQELKIVTDTTVVPVTDTKKERSNAQELQNFVDTTFPPVGDMKLNTQNTLAHSIFAREKITIVKAVCYLGWTFQDVVNYLNARSRGKTTTKAYNLDFTKTRKV